MGFRAAFCGTCVEFLAGCAAPPQAPAEERALLIAWEPDAPADTDATSVAAASPAVTAPAEAPQPPPTVDPPPAGPLDAAALSPLYASLFEKSRSFTFRVETESSHYDPDDKKADKHGNVVTRSKTTISCKVTELRELPGARAAVLDCGTKGNQSFTMGLDDVTPAGVYAATADGLFRFPLGTRGPTAFDPKAMILPRNPTPVRHEEKHDEGESSDELLQRKDGAWCSSRDDMVGDASHHSFCFVQGKGPSEMVGGWDGGSSHYATFTLLGG